VEHLRWLASALGNPDDKAAVMAVAQEIRESLPELKPAPAPKGKAPVGNPTPKEPPAPVQAEDGVIHVEAGNLAPADPLVGKLGHLHCGPQRLDALVDLAARQHFGQTVELRYDVAHLPNVHTVLPGCRAPPAAGPVQQVRVAAAVTHVVLRVPTGRDCHATREIVVPVMGQYIADMLLREKAAQGVLLYAAARSLRSTLRIRFFVLFSWLLLPSSCVLSKLTAL